MDADRHKDQDEDGDVANNEEWLGGDEVGENVYSYQYSICNTMTFTFFREILYRFIEISLFTK